MAEEKKEPLEEEMLTEEAVEQDSVEQDPKVVQDAEERTEESSEKQQAEDLKPEDAKADAGGQDETETTMEQETETKIPLKEKKKKKKDKKDEKIEELNDRLLRNMAEFENFRNRSEKEKAAMFEIGAKSVIEKILPVMDSFERGMQAVPEEGKDDAFVKGMEAIYKQFATTLEEIGVVPIEAVGKEFDLNLHNAVMHEENEEMGANIVSEEFQKGYMYKDSVVRHSMVKVVN